MSNITSTKWKAMKQPDLRLCRGAIVLICDDKNKQEVMQYEARVKDGKLDVTGVLCVRESCNRGIRCLGFRIDHFHSSDLYLDLSRFILLYPAPDEDAYINRMEEVDVL